jgi:hypothetical protein
MLHCCKTQLSIWDVAYCKFVCHVANNAKFGSSSPRAIILVASHVVTGAAAQATITLVLVLALVKSLTK